MMCTSKRICNYRSSTMTTQNSTSRFFKYIKNANQFIQNIYGLSYGLDSQTSSSDYSVTIHYSSRHHPTSFVYIHAGAGRTRWPLVDQWHGVVNRCIPSVKWPHHRNSASRAPFLTGKKLHRSSRGTYQRDAPWGLEEKQRRNLVVKPQKISPVSCETVTFTLPETWARHRPLKIGQSRNGKYSSNPTIDFHEAMLVYRREYKLFHPCKLTN